MKKNEIKSITLFAHCETVEDMKKKNCFNDMKRAWRDAKKRQIGFDWTANILTTFFLSASGEKKSFIYFSSMKKTCQASVLQDKK